MRLCVRLAAMAGLLVAVAMGLIALRTDVHQAGGRLHALFEEKRRLERECARLELRVARLRSQDQVREQADAFEPPVADSSDTDSPEPTGGARTVTHRAPPAPP